MGSRRSVEASGATFQYGREHGVADISFVAVPGEWVALFGSAGSGKSTLLGLLTGRLRLSGGSVTILGGQVERSHSSVGCPDPTALSGRATAVARLLAGEAASHGVPA